MEIKYITLYGSLTLNSEKYKEFNLDKHLKYIQQCQFSATLYDLGDFPAILLNNNGFVEGQLFEILNLSVFKILDEYESYFENDFEHKSGAFSHALAVS